MLTAAYRSFSTLFLQDEHVLYFSNAFINSFTYHSRETGVF